MFERFRAGTRRNMVTDTFRRSRKTFANHHTPGKKTPRQRALSAADREALLAHVSGIEELEIRRAFLELSFGWIEQVAALPDQVRLLCAHCKGWCEPKAAEEEEAEQEGQGQNDGLVEAA